MKRPITLRRPSCTFAMPDCQPCHGFMLCEWCQWNWNRDLRGWIGWFLR